MKQDTLQSIPHLVSVSDFQRSAKKVFSELDDSVPTIVLNRNRAIGVVLKPSVYEQLMDELEDRYMGGRLKKLVQESDDSDFEPWEKLEGKLIQAGKLTPLK